jgi:hypothetical protein
MSAWKFFPGTPLRRTSDVPVDMIIVNHFIHLGSNPQLSNTFKMAACSTVSKALAKSSFRITEECLLVYIGEYIHKPNQHNPEYSLTVRIHMYQIEDLALQAIC